MPEEIKLPYFKSLKFLVGKQDWNPHLLMSKSMFIFRILPFKKWLFCLWKIFVIRAW